MAKDKQKIILAAILCATFLFTGWTAGSSLGYRRGLAQAELQQTHIQIDKSRKVTPVTQKLVRAASKARSDLLIRYKNLPDRDFATLLSVHQKNAALFCEAYQKFALSENLLELCKNDVIPFVTKIRSSTNKYLSDNGLK